MIIATDQDTDSTEWHYAGYLHDNLLSLLSTSGFEGRLKQSIENEINDTENMTQVSYDKICFNLSSNQLDRITSGLMYNQNDIIQHLRKLR